MSKMPILITFDIDPLTRDERIRYGIPLNEEQKFLLKKSLQLASDLTFQNHGITLSEREEFGQ
jgi:hypothetical protein